jgi:predicted DCC family thiol-disulfide oxidoreductase YuxK
MTLASQAVRLWDTVWFQNQSTTPLEIIRIGLGGLMLVTYGLIGLEDLVILYSDAGFFTKEVLLDYGGRPYYASVFYYLSTTWQLYFWHAVFVLSFAAFTLGWHTALAKWIVLIGHLSYMNGNPMATYGVDSILAANLFILCLAPVGKGFSMDRVRLQRRIKRAGPLEAGAATVRSPWGFACTRLIQIQMATLFFYSGLSKLEGSMWHEGSALWFAMLNNEIASFPPDFFARHFWVVQALTYATVVFELVYVITIWPKLTRGISLLGAIALHVGIVVFMGMPYFGLAMIVGHLSFLHHDWLHAFGQYWKRKAGSMQMLYDGKCGFCVRSMATFLAYDGLQQITAHDYRRTSLQDVTLAEASAAIYLIDESGRKYSGFDAYRHAVVRIPGLWWLVPLFYIPWLSAAVGRPLYRWIAANRQTVSKYIS